MAAETNARTSRVGKRPVVLPKGVEVTINASNVAVKGPKGNLSRTFPAEVELKKEGDAVLVSCNAPGSAAPRLQGMVRALVRNMVQGVSEGYTKKLELHGTGYRAELKGNNLHMLLGFSHPVDYTLPANVKVDIPKDSKGTRLTLSGPDKEAIGQAAATIRGFRPPEPYSGKGVRYAGERVREKAGKAGK